MIALVLLALAGSPVQLEPTALRLGSEPDAAIVFVVPGAKSVSASSANGVGALSPAERIGDGRFRARFSFPKERFPQLALIRLEIEADTGAHVRRWVALPLIAKADLEIETKPHASVTVTIGAQQFGPAVANARGKVTIAAQVPPGFASGTLLAVDRAGNQTTKPLDLLPRPYLRTAGVLTNGEATTAQPAQLEIFAVEPDGQPLLKAEALKVSAKLGAVDAPITKGEGVFLATYRAPASVAAGLDVISIGVEGTSASTQLEVKLRAGALARLVITVTPPTYTAGTALASKLSAEAVDAHGNPVPMDKPVFTSDFGRIEATPEGPELRVPDDFEGRTQAKVHVTANNASGDATLALLAAAPTRADVTFPPRMAAGEKANGQLAVFDAFGNPVEHASVAAVVTTQLGELGPRVGTAIVTEAGVGRYDLELSTEPAEPGRLEQQPGEHELQITANSKPIAHTSLTVRHYQRRWAFTLGAMGFVQSNLSQWVSGGPRLWLGLRIAGTHLDVVGEGAYGFFAAARARSADGGAFTIELREFAVLVGARYWIPVGVRAAIQLSILVGLQNTGSTVSGPTLLSKISQSATAPLLRAGGGLGFSLGIGRVVVQLEYTLAPVDGVVRGNVGGVGLCAGYLASF